MDITAFVNRLEQLLRIGITIIFAYFIALWIACVWWAFRDIRATHHRHLSADRGDAARGRLQLARPADLHGPAAAEDARPVVRGLARGRSVPAGHPGPQLVPGVQAARRARLYFLSVVPDAPEADLRALRAAADAALENVPVLRHERVHDAARRATSAPPPWPPCPSRRRHRAGRSSRRGRRPTATRN